jgi:hypothetical protein
LWTIGYIPARRRRRGGIRCGDALYRALGCPSTSGRLPVTRHRRGFFGLEAAAMDKRVLGFFLYRDPQKRSSCASNLLFGSWPRAGAVSGFVTMCPTLFARPLGCAVVCGRDEGMDVQEQPRRRCEAGRSRHRRAEADQLQVAPARPAGVVCSGWAISVLHSLGELQLRGR